MNIHLKALDDAGMLIFESSIVVDAQALVEVAKERIPLARARGQTFTEGAVPFFATELVQAAQRSQPDSELHKQAINVAMAAWLADVLYGGVSRIEFVSSNLHFTLLPSGSVKYDRISKPA